MKSNDIVADARMMHLRELKTALAAAKADEKVAPMLEGMQIVKELYVPGKLVNLVVKPQ